MYYTETVLPEIHTVTQTIHEDDQGRNWYEELIEDYDYESPQRGQILEGQILRIDEDALLVDVGLKRDAIVPSRDLNQLTDIYLKNLTVGDQVVVYVTHPATGDRDLLVSLNKGIEYEDWESVENHQLESTPLEVEVVGYNRGGLLVKYRSLQGFVPYSHVPELRRMRDRQRTEEIKQDLIGSPLTVKAIELDRKRERLIFSAQAAQEERRRQRLNELQVGQIIYGHVVNIVNFGVFVGLGGIDGLVHISELDWQQVKHPSKLFKVGDEIEVQIKEIDLERERVSLSRKALLPSPWDSVTENFHTGDCVEGRVNKVVDFGAFVELSEGIVGLLHVSEVGYGSAEKPQEVLKRDERVLVRILDIDPVGERISLSMRRVPLEKQIAWTMDSMPGEEPAPSETSQAEPTL